jgi:hypothetical protein
MSVSNPDQPDYSMLSRRWSGAKLITSQVALEIARLVHKQAEGESDLASNEPLTAAEEGDTWVVTGSKIVRYDPKDEKLDGSLRIVISQFDAQILSYTLAFVLPRDFALPKSNDA